MYLIHLLSVSVIIETNTNTKCLSCASVMNSFQSIFKPLKFDFWGFLFSSAIKRLLIKICGELKNVFDIVSVCLSVRKITNKDGERLKYSNCFRGTYVQSC